VNNRDITPSPSERLLTRFAGFRVTPILRIARQSLLFFAIVESLTTSALALSPTLDVRCCMNRSSPACHGFDKTEEECRQLVRSFDEFAARWNAEQKSGIWVRFLPWRSPLGAACWALATAVAVIAWRHVRRARRRTIEGF